MSDMEFDFSEVMQLAADLGEASVEIVPFARKAVQVTATHVKKDWQSGAKKLSGEHAKGYPHTIDYEMKLDTDGVIGAEIGPDIERYHGQAALGILEDAPGGVAAAPQHAGRNAAKKNEKDFMEGLRKAGEDALG